MAKDYLIRACDASHTVRAFACVSTDLVRQATEIHQLSPIVGAALGRLLTASLLMGDTLKGKDDTLTLQIRGDGELKSLIAIADSQGHTRGRASNPIVLLPPNKAGHLNVGGAIGHGTLTVIRDMHLKKPYVSTVPLQTGEIGDDITYYYASSEQTPSSVGLGVLYDKESVTVKVAGGFLIQLLPNCPEPFIITLEENLAALGNVTALLEEGKTAEYLLEKVMDGLDIEILERKEISYECTCSRERMERALKSLGKEELKKIIDDGKPIEVRCDFCNKTYSFSKEDIESLLEE